MFSKFLDLIEGKINIKKLKINSRVRMKHLFCKVGMLTFI